MNTEQFFLGGFITEGELDKLEKRLRLRDKFAKMSTKARIQALENDLGRVALLARALADLCLSNGLLTRDELVRKLLEADLADGKRDQRLQAKVVMPGESKAADPDPTKDSAKKAKRKRTRPYP